MAVPDLPTGSGRGRPCVSTCLVTSLQLPTSPAVLPPLVSDLRFSEKLLIFLAATVDLLRAFSLVLFEGLVVNTSVLDHFLTRVLFDAAVGDIFLSESLLGFLPGVVALLTDEALRSLVSPLISECLLKPAVGMRLTTSPSPTGLPSCVAATEVATTVVLGPVLTIIPPPCEMTATPWEEAEVSLVLRGLEEGEDGEEEGLKVALAFMLLLLMTLLLSAILSTPIVQLLYVT